MKEAHVVPDCISVCICTFRRPQMLACLLDELAAQAVDPAFRIELVVVDNDKDRSGEETVRTFQLGHDTAINYYCEPQQNISLARNKAVGNARGNLIAFIDDDERPGPNWLINLHSSLKTYRSHGVLGPILPEFPPGAPKWLQQESVQRRRLPTGTQISSRDARTGNVLLLRSVFANDDTWFDPSFGRTGGEDGDFFRRQLRKGCIFIWCDEAPVHELVPQDRWKISFHIKRYLRSGTLSGERMRSTESSPILPLTKNFLIFCGCTAAAALSLVLPKHIWMRFAQKAAYCCGVMTAYCGLSLLRYRD